MTGFSREGGFGGGVIIRSILANYPQDRLLWLTLDRDVKAGSLFDKGRQAMAPSPGVLYPVKKILKAVFAIVAARREASWIMRRMAAFNPQVCWLVLDFNSVLAFKRVMQKTSAPMHVSVHDDPVLATRLCRYPVPSWIVNRAFAFCYQRAQSRDCISDRMSAAYEKRYHVRASVVTRGVRVPPSPQGRSLDKGIHIILGGTGNCPAPWPRPLFEAIGMLQKTMGRTVEFHCFDPAVRPTESFVKVHPLLPDREFERFLAGMHIGYACDPLTPLGRQFAASSLPTKIITYIGAGLPFLYQGPGDSTVGDWLEKTNTGVIVESNDAEKIHRGFARIIEKYAEMSRACSTLAKSEFDSEIIQARVLGGLSRIARKYP
jgi:hypothetical protein